jgi:photosystem II stability/assembly factor-like uncharacterized protein
LRLDGKWLSRDGKNKIMKKIKIIVLLFGVFFLGACSLTVKKSGVGATDGGVFVTNNKGDSWRQMPYIPTIAATPESIATLDVNKLVIDPNDSGAVYLSTAGNGVFYTYNIGRGWNKILSLPGNISATDIAVDNKNKCILYISYDNKLEKSIDCGRSFSQVYFDNNPGVSVSAIALDHYDTNIIYIGTSRGDILRSLDGGESWRAIQRLNDGIKELLVNPKDSRVIFVATVKNGIFRFNSAGGATLEELEQYRNQFDNNNWTNYNESLKEFNLGLNFRDMVFSYEDNSLLLATDKVILRSFDEGQSWTQLSLLTPDKDSSINAMAVNPQNNQEIFYITTTSFYRSYDGGNTWTVKKLPTTRQGNALLIDFNNPNIMYMGIKKPAK